jgi:hypothetical protein
MRLAIIVLAHDRPAQLALLLRSLEHAETRIYLHVDRRRPLEPFQAELERAGGPQPELLPRHACRWGGPGLVDAALEGLTQAVRDGCDYFILLSGQDYPLEPVDEIVGFFSERRDESFVEHFPLAESGWAYDGRMRTDFYSYDIVGRRETCFPKGQEPALTFKGRILNHVLRLWTATKPERRFPPYVQAMGGSQWWNLSRDAARFVLDFTAEHSDYREYHRYTLQPDEIFFQSILLGTSFSETHRIVNDPLRFMIWPAGSYHPRTLGAEDVPDMLASGKPFARKFDFEADRSVLQALPH